MLWLQYRYVVIATSLSLALVGVVTARQGLLGQLQPGKSDCISCADVLAPGIGFALTATYATVVLNYRNGTIIDLGKVGANTLSVYELSSNASCLIQRSKRPRSIKMSCHACHTFIPEFLGEN